MTPGAQCVTTSGIHLMHKWSAGNWNCPVKVSSRECPRLGSIMSLSPTL